MCAAAIKTPIRRRSEGIEWQRSLTFNTHQLTIVYYRLANNICMRVSVSSDKYKWAFTCVQSAIHLIVIWLVHVICSEIAT